MTATLPAIASQIEAQILKGCGAAVEWCFRSGDHFTIVGNCVDVNRAVLFCIDNDLCTLDGNTIYDPELDQSFAYMKAV